MTITTNSLLWLRRRQRFMVSYEKLTIHGYSLQQAKEKFGTLTEKERSIAAGNMFSGFSLGPNLLANLVHVGHWSA